MANPARCIAVCVMVTGMSATLPAEDWPMWRGQKGDGISHELDAPLHWSPTENVAWRTPIRGVGYSSPITWGDAIFLTSADLETEERLLLRIDRESGEVLWTRTVATASIEEMHRQNSPASGTPATDGQRVYVMFQTGDELLVKAYDFDGNEAWSQVPGEFESRHGFNSSPVIVGQSLLISGMQDGDDAFIARLNCKTGAIEWKTGITEPVRSFSTPFLFRTNGQRVAVLSGANRTIGYDADRGNILWTVKGPAEKTVSSLVCNDEHVFVAGGRDNVLLAIRPTGLGDITTTHVAWRANRGIPYITSPLSYGGFLHVVSDEGIYSCFDPADGDLLLQKRLGGKWSSSPVGVCQRIYLTNELGETTVVRADPKFEVLSRNDIGEPVFASIAVADGSIYLRSKVHLYRISHVENVTALGRNK